MPAIPSIPVKRQYILFIAALALLVLPSLAAHVPQKSGLNDTLEDALHIEDPLKSWVFYSELAHSEDARYYVFNLAEADRMVLSLMTPDKGQFSPVIVLVGENVASFDVVPPYIETYDGEGIKIIRDEKGDAEFEPFTPGSYYFTAEHKETLGQDATYHVIVYEPDGNTGSFALVVGYQELFSPIEFVRVPWDAIWIHRWEGQSLFRILLPQLLVVVAGIALAYSRHTEAVKPHDKLGWAMLAVGIVYIGSGMVFLNQTAYALLKSGLVPSSVVSLVFAFVPIVLGILACKFAYADRAGIRGGDRAKAVLYGLLGLVTWSGIIAFPLLAIVVGFMPKRVLS